MQRSAHEKLISQVLFIEENIDYMQDMGLENKAFSTKEDIRLFFNDYIKKTEMLFEEIYIDNSDHPKANEHLNHLPFIVLDSWFTLCDKDNRFTYGYLSRDNVWDGRKDIYQLYFLSEAGLALLLKEVGSIVHINIGKGYADYKITSVKMI